MRLRRNVGRGMVVEEMGLALVRVVAVLRRGECGSVMGLSEGTRERGNAGERRRMP